MKNTSVDELIQIAPRRNLFAISADALQSISWLWCPEIGLRAKRFSFEPGNEVVRNSKLVIAIKEKD